MKLVNPLTYHKTKITYNERIYKTYGKIGKQNNNAK